MGAWQYKLTDDEIAVARCVAARRRAMNGGQTNLGHGEVDDHERRLQNDTMACMGEIAVSRLLNLCWTGCAKGSRQRGRTGSMDVGDCIEVRSVGRRSLGLIANKQDKGPVPVVLIEVMPSGRCEALGWALYDEVVAKGELRNAETDKPFRTLDAWLLHDMDSLMSSVRPSLDDWRLRRACHIHEMDDSVAEESALG